MREIFERNQERLTDAEDRRVWRAMRDEVRRRRPSRKRWGIPLTLFATVTAAAVVVSLVNRGSVVRPTAAPDLPVVHRTDLDRDRAGELKPEEQPLARNLTGNEATAEAPEAAAPFTPPVEEPTMVAAEKVHPPTPNQMQRGGLLDRNNFTGDEKLVANALFQNAIRGRVTDKKGAPLRFANVVLEGTRIGALSDSSGAFAIMNVPAGSYTLCASYLGYELAKEPVKVEAEGELAQNFELEEEPLMAEVIIDAQTSADQSTRMPRRTIVQDDIQSLPKDKLKETGAPKKGDTEQAGELHARGERESKAENERPELANDELRVARPPSPATDAEAGASAGRASSAEAADQSEGDPYKGTNLNLPTSEFQERDLSMRNAYGKPAPPRGQPIPIGGSRPVNGKVFDAVFTEHYGVNPFIDPEDDRFATFAMDVDNASYSFARSYLQRGVLPPKDGIRVEEFVNSFQHHYAPPRDALVAYRDGAASEHGTFAIHLDAAPSPFGKGLVLMRVGLKGREVDYRDRKPATLTFVVDVSGSMARENRLELVKRALFMLLDQMNEEDRVALVVYGTNARTLLPHTPVYQRHRIEDAIRRLHPEGATNAEAGLREGYRLAANEFDRNTINRVILCSDGVANVGRTGAEDILDVIKRQAGKGIYLTTVGFGMGNYNDVLMEKLANKGDGNYYYVDDLDEARKVFVENLTGTLQTIARDAKIQVEFNPNTVRRYRLLGYENRDVADKDFRNDAVDAGEVGAGHEVTALFEVKLNDKARRHDLATVRIRYEDPETGRVTEEARAIRVQDIEPRFERCDPTLRMDAAVAEFAEILRHSYWAKDGSLAQTLGVARDASRDLGSPAELDEMVRLVETAWRLWPAEQPTEWRDDVRPMWEPGDERR